MSQAAPAITRSPAEVVRSTPVSQAANGICYAMAGEVAVNSFDLERMVAAVPGKVAAALDRKAYYFVPLTVSRSEEHTSELQSQSNLVCRLLLEKKNKHGTFLVAPRARITVAALSRDDAAHDGGQFVLEDLLLRPRDLRQRPSTAVADAVDVVH